MKIVQYILIGIMLLVNHSVVLGQDSLTTIIAQKFSYEFQITNDELVGAGAEFLKQESKSSQYTLIGEYHGSKRISEFTEALIPELAKNSYKYFALEVGPISAKKLSSICKSKTTIKETLYEFNTKYNYDDDYTAIPFFSNKEDADFLIKASMNDWKLIGLDQEFYFAFPMLLDEMYKGLEPSLKSKFKAVYNKAKDSLNSIIIDDIAEKRRLPTSVFHSEEIQEFLDKMKGIESNKSTVEAFRKSIEIYKYNGDRKWRENNEQRALYMKANLRKNMERMEFDMYNDKMLLKLGGYHNSRGQSPMEVFDIGNTVSELAEFYGNSSLHIAFTSRFYMDEGKEVDELLEDPNGRYNVFSALGKKDSWVVIDLREIQHGLYYYPIQYRVTEAAEDLIKRYDLLIIPPLDMDPTPNYKVRK